MKKIFFVFCCKSQNIVPNGSFENYISCSDGSIENAPPWFNPTASSPDYYNVCSSNINLKVPTNWIGSQNAKSGSAYSGIGLFCNACGSDIREYIEIKLSDSLKQGQKYCVSFYVSLADKSQYAADMIGAYFSKDSSADMSTLSLLPYTPQIQNPKGNILSDTVNWVLISDTLTAIGGEKFITIGNFYPDSMTTLVDMGNIGTYSYYYLEDVSVVLCDSGNSIHEFYGERQQVSIWLNPGDGRIQLKYRLAGGKEGELCIYDLSGRKIFVHELTDEIQGQNTINLSNLTDGIYFYSVSENKEKIKSGKLIINR